MGKFSLPILIVLALSLCGCASREIVSGLDEQVESKPQDGARGQEDDAQREHQRCNRRARHLDRGGMPWR